MPSGAGGGSTTPRGLLLTGRSSWRLIRFLTGFQAPAANSVTQASSLPIMVANPLRYIAISIRASISVSASSEKMSSVSVSRSKVNLSARTSCR